MKPISEELIIYNPNTGYRYRSYKDKNIEYEEEYTGGESDKKLSSYFINATTKNKKQPSEVKQVLDKTTKVDINSLMYFMNLRKDNTIPISLSKKEVGYSFLLDNSDIMDFKLDFPDSMYVMDLKNTILIMDSMNKDPFDIKNKLVNEVKILGDRLFIIDYKNGEFYDLTSKYKSTISGRLCKYGIKEYKTKEDNEEWITHIVNYDKKGDVKSIDSPWNYNSLYKYKSRFNDEEIIDYYLPYIKTSEGVVTSTDRDKIFCTKSTKIDNDGMLTTNISYQILDKKELVREEN